MKSRLAVILILITVIAVLVLMNFIGIGENGRLYWEKNRRIQPEEYRGEYI